MIEHVHDQEKFLQNSLRLAKPDNSLFFLSSIAKTPEGWFLNIFMGERVLGLLPRGTHEFNLLINPETIEQVAHAGNHDLGVKPF